MKTLFIALGSLLFAGAVHARYSCAIGEGAARARGYRGNINLLSDSNIRGPKYQKLIEGLNAEVKASKVPTRLGIYGASIERRPLSVYKMQYTRRANPDVVIITGSTHGNEYLSIADNLMRAFLRKPSLQLQEFLMAGGIIYFVPVFNPDGYDRRRRHNNNNKDLNRDFDLKAKNHKGFKQQETVAWRKFLQSELQGKNLRFVMDYHCCNGSLLFPWSHTKEALPPEDLNVYRHIGELMKENFPSYRYGSTGQILGYYPVGTSKDFYYETYSALSFTFEGAYGKEDKNLLEHYVMWNGIFSFLRAQRQLNDLFLNN